MCEITIKQDKIRIIIDEIFRIVIFNMYITHNILHLVNYNLFLFYEFATNKNLTCAQLMRKSYQLERPSLIKYIVYITFGQNNPGQVNISVCISYSVNSNAHTTPVRIYDEPCAHKFCAVEFFVEYHPSSSTRCQVPSRVRAWD